MTANTVSQVVSRLRRAAHLHAGADLTDAELLEHYISRQDHAAFEVLLRRHGPMVFGVCRRILRNETDAEDAFQATFLVLVRKAASLRAAETVGNWLYGVAYNTALKAKAMKSRRRTKEREAALVPRSQASEEVWTAVQALLDKEMMALPEKFRIPIILCDLEGKSIKEIVRQLGWPQGTVASRLARGRAMLAQRLREHGLILSAGALIILLTQGALTASVPPTLMLSTIKVTSLLAVGQAALAGVVSAKVVAITEGVVQAMFLTKLKSCLAVGLISVVLLGASSGILTQSTSAQDVGAPAEVARQKPRATTPAKEDDDPVRLKKEIERLKAELAKTRLDLQKAQYENIILKAQAELAKVQAESARLKAPSDDKKTKDPVPSLPRQPQPESEASKPPMGINQPKSGNLPPGPGYVPETLPKKTNLRSGFTDGDPDLQTPSGNNPITKAPIVSSQPVLVAASPDGSRVVVAQKQMISMIDTKTGKILFQSTLNTEPINALSFSPDGKILVSCSKDKSVILSDPLTGKELRRIVLQNPVNSIRLSGDGQKLMAIEGDGSHVEVDLETGKMLGRTKQDPLRK